MDRRYTFFMLLRTTRDWLALSRPERRRFMAEVFAPILSKRPGVRLRYFDAEAFSARCTDIAVWEVSVLQDYYFLIDDLRDTAFFSLPYYEIVEIIPAIEEGFAEYDEAHGVAA